MFLLLSNIIQGNMLNKSIQGLFLLSGVLDKVLNKSDAANKINMEKSKNTQLKGKKQKFDRQGLFLFCANPNSSPKERALEEQKHQEDLLELMAMYQAYHNLVQEKLYAIRGSKLMCLYGTKPALLDTLEDHGVYVGNMPVMACNDCRQANIHNFGSCMCPESMYEKRGLPMTVEVHPNGELAHKAPWNKRPHICVPLLGEHARWIQEENELLITNIDNEEMEMVLTDEATLTCMYGGIIMIGEVPENKNNENIPIILDGWLTLYTEPTVSVDGREVLKHPNAANYDWAMPEDLINHSEDWFETESPVKKEISRYGDFEVQMISNNLYTDYEGRYWVAVGPNVMTPEHSKEKVNHPIPVKDMCYGTKIDIVVLNEEENIFYYIPAVVGDAKEHSYPDGLYQTGIPFDSSRPVSTSKNKNTVEFIGYQITRKIYEDGNEKSTINITNNYKLIKIIVYDGVFNYE